MTTGFSEDKRIAELEQKLSRIASIIEDDGLSANEKVALIEEVLSGEG